jgi:hypothetical protein
MIFGMSAIISTPPNILPPLVSERLPEIVKQLCLLCNKMRDQRLLILKDNEESLAEDQKNKDDDEEEVEDVEDGDEDETKESEDVFAKAAKKSKKEEVDEEISDDSDSDYEFTGGDLAIYDSALDPIDELLYVKENLERINAADPSYANKLLSGMTPEELAKFNENMQTAQALKDREEIVRRQCDEMIDKKKFD